MIPNRQSGTVDLAMRCELAADLSSPAQRARVITEAWVGENMYCPACECDELVPTPRGTKLIDFHCAECDEGFQVKSKKHGFGRKVLDSAWGPMEDAAASGDAPGFMFLRYNLEPCRVSDLFVVPGHFVTPMVIQRRRPLRPSARRHGWIGCNILLDRIAGSARIPVVELGAVRRPREVRDLWRRFAFVKEAEPADRGWTGDVLSCVQRLGKETFDLDEMYGFENQLAKRHPQNQNVKPKIRQQLQILRDHGVLEFLGRGEYRLR